VCCALLIVLACSDGKSGMNAIEAGTTGGGAGGAGGTTGGAGGAGGASSGGTGGAGASGDAPLGGGMGGSGGAGGTPSGGSGGEPAPDAGESDAGNAPTTACTRESLRALVDDYFAALSAHDPSSLPLAAGVKLTENGTEVSTEEGLWQSAGALVFKHSAFDTTQCMTVTEAVVAEDGEDIPVGLRLKVESGAITEIETIAVREGDYFVASNTGAIEGTASEMWEELLPEADRSSREELLAIIDDYFTYFPAGGCGFADDCVRYENGFSLDCAVGLSCDTSGSGSGGTDVRLSVIDEEAGIAVGFVMFAGSYTDMHMFRVYAGEVHGVHAILAEADGPGWE
jgi:hypothetical protein